MGTPPAALFPGYGVPPGSYSAPLPRSTSPTGLIVAVAAALAVAVTAVSAISVNVTPAVGHYACQQDCGRPPIGPPVGGDLGQAANPQPPVAIPPNAAPLAGPTYP